MERTGRWLRRKWSGEAERFGWRNEGVISQDQEGEALNVDAVLLSDWASVDSSGKLTVVGMFNRIGPAKLPIRLRAMCVSVIIRAHHSEAGSSHHLEMRLLNQRRDVVEVLENNFTWGEPEVPGVPLQHYWLRTILAPEFGEAGAFAFEIFIDGTYHGAVNFTVLEAQG